MLAGTAGLEYDFCSERAHPGLRLYEHLPEQFRLIRKVFEHTIDAGDYTELGGARGVETH